MNAKEKDEEERKKTFSDKIKVLNPYDGVVVDTVPAGTVDDVKKAIESGISNLSNQGNEFNHEDIYIERAFVDEGPTMKRFRPRAMGRASQILKRTCHLTLTLTK